MITLKNPFDNSLPILDGAAPARPIDYRCPTCDAAPFEWCADRDANTPTGRRLSMVCHHGRANGTHWAVEHGEPIYKDKDSTWDPWIDVANRANLSTGAAKKYANAYCLAAHGREMDFHSSTKASRAFRRLQLGGPIKEVSKRSGWASKAMVKAVKRWADKQGEELPESVRDFK